jgi:hypothetical protein
MTDAPERIWLIESDRYNPYRVSCSIAHHSSDEATEYVRADIAERENAELRAKIKDQTDAGYCDAQHLSDGPPYRCGWQQRAETAERQLAERDADLARLIRAGAGMANLLYNASQSSFAEPELHQSMKAAQLAWDAARAALAGSGSGGWRDMSSAPIADGVIIEVQVLEQVRKWNAARFHAAFDGDTREFRWRYPASPSPAGGAE